MAPAWGLSKRCSTKKRSAMSYCYSRGIDRHDEAMLRPAYHGDAVDDHGAFIGGPAALAEYANRIRSRNWASHQHHVTNKSIELDGDRAHKGGEEVVSRFHREASSLGESCRGPRNGERKNQDYLPSGLLAAVSKKLACMRARSAPRPVMMSKASAAWPTTIPTPLSTRQPLPRAILSNSVSSGK